MQERLPRAGVRVPNPDSLKMRGFAASTVIHARLPWMAGVQVLPEHKHAKLESRS